MAFLDDLYGTATRGYLAVWDRETKKTRFYAHDKLTLNCKEKPNIYFAVALQEQPLTKQRGTAATTCGIPCLFSDLDWGKRKKPNMPPDQAAADLILESFPLKFSILNQSGPFGYHVYWLFKEFWHFDTDTEREQAASLLRSFQTSLLRIAESHGWTLDATHDLARVLRLPGTRNGEFTVRTIEDTGLRYNPSDFERFLVETETIQSVVGLLTLSANAMPPTDKWEALTINEPRALQSFLHTRPDLNDKSPSGYDMSLARFAALAAWNDQEIGNLLIMHRRTHSEDLKLNRLDYYESTIKRARADIALEAGEEVELPDSECRARMLDILGERLKVKIEHVFKTNTAGGSTYRLAINGNTLKLGAVAGLISQERFRNAVAETTSRYIPQFKGREWANIAQLLLNVCELQETSEDTTERGRVVAWIEAYLEECPPVSDEWQAAAENHRPFAKEGDIYLDITGLKHFLCAGEGERLASSELGELLRSSGYVPGRMTVRVGDKTIGRYTWKIL